MSKKFYPITQANFDEASKHIQGILAHNSKKNLMAKIIIPVSSVLFVFLSLLMTYGLLYQLSSPEEMFIFNAFPKITALWNKISGLFIKPENAWYISVLLGLVILYVIPFALSLIISIICSIAFASKKEEPLSGTKAQQAKELHQIATKAYGYHRATDFDSVPTIGSTCYVVAIAALLIYAFWKLGFFTSLTGRIFSMAFGMLACLLVLFFIYKLLVRISVAINSLFIKTTACYDATTATDTYWLSVDPEEKKRREEEAARLAREAEERRANAPALRIRALELERRGDYAEAKRLFHQAALDGDALGMDNYARHCLIAGNRSDAIYWLERSIDTGEADDLSYQLLRALKNGEHVDAHYN